MNLPRVPISIGELLDKITILEIKSNFTNNEYVVKELEKLNEIKKSIEQCDQYYIDLLKDINKELWDVEDKLRKLEKEQRFDNEFISLARSVYKLNDRRAEIKRKINEITDSELKEVKIYD